MIQTLGDVFLLVAIVSVGVVSFLLAVLLYHLIFVVMDLKEVMKRLNEGTQEIEEMLLKPVEFAAEVSDWLQKHIWEAYFADGGSEGGKRKKKGKHPA